ncbi:MAG: N-acetyltransferase family protein [Alphaproteobacteria bacterium]
MAIDTTHAMTIAEPSTVAVRDAVEEDLSAVSAIYAQHVVNGLASFEEIAPDAAEMSRRFRALCDRGLPYLVAELDGTIGGYAYAGPFRPRAAYRHTVEDSVYVAAEMTGRGIGQSLLTALIDRCTELDYRQMIAVIGDGDSAGSIRLHQKLGFRYAAWMPSVGFKHGRWVDLALMQRPLGPGDTVPPSRLQS